MTCLWDIYSPDLPPSVTEAMAAPEMRRLQHVGMNCGCEYTSFPLFRRIREPYSRFDHSVGAALLIWRFTGDIRQTLAGLFHDIATPCFAHVVDFMLGDSMNQEATEAGTRDFIERSDSIQALLRKNGLTTDDVADYRRYPIADNDSPQLSADRLEYTLGNLVNYQVITRDTVIYRLSAFHRDTDTVLAETERGRGGSMISEHEEDCGTYGQGFAWTAGRNSFCAKIQSESDTAKRRKKVRRHV